MSSQGTSVTLVYMAYNTSTGAYVTGDVANHTLKLVKDGTEASPTNSPSEVDATNAKGAYKLVLTSAETSFNVVWLGGVSSTANVIIIPTQISFELLPTAAPNASGGLLTFGTGAGQMNVDGAGNVSSNLQKILGTASAGAAGSVSIDWAHVVNPTSTVGLTNTTILGGGGGAPTVAQIATAVWQDTTGGDFTVAGSIGKGLFTSGAAPGANGGLPTVNASNQVKIDGTSVLTEAYSTNGGAKTLANGIYELCSIFENATLSALTLTTYKIDGLTPAMTFNVNASPNPTSRLRAT